MDPAILKVFLDSYENGDLLDPQQMLPKLRTDPKEFLRNYPTAINERPGPSAEIAAYLHHLGNTAQSPPLRPGKVLGTRRMHATAGFHIHCSAGVPASTHALTRAVFRAHYVEMRLSTAPVAWYPLVAGPDLLLTCKLSGCSFMVRDNVGVIECTHIKPSGVAGSALQQHLQTTYPGATVFGAHTDYDSAKHTCTIIGVRRGGQWKIYAQKQVAQLVQSLGVKRVYPPGGSGW